MISEPLFQKVDSLVGAGETRKALALARAAFRQVDRTRLAELEALYPVLFQAHAYAEAAEVGLLLARQKPGSIEAAFQAGKSLELANQPEGAERVYREVLRSEPQCVEAKLNLAIAIRSQGRISEACEILESLLLEAPEGANSDLVRYNLGWHRIRDGKFKEGMKWICDGRRLGLWGSIRGAPERPILEPGLSLDGKTVLIVGEGGFGDEVIAARFGQTIRDRGGRAHWLGPKHQSIFARIPGIESVIPPERAATIHYDYWAPAMDLPASLDLELEEIPNSPYLVPDPGYSRLWKDRLRTRGTGNLRVGLRWQGNAAYQLNLPRSVPISAMSSLAEIDGIEFYSLQRDDGEEDLHGASWMADWGRELRSWEDTAGAIANLDLVISSCTSVAHVAAAMGKPVWLLCPIFCYYPWAVPGARSHWYPSVRIFRQSLPRSWTDPLAEVAADLRVEARKVYTRENR